MTVHFHGQTDGLEYEDGPPLPVLTGCPWCGQETCFLGACAKLEPIDPEPEPELTWALMQPIACTCPWCRSLNAQVTGDD